jgi:hypothetical protein
MPDAMIAEYETVPTYDTSDQISDSSFEPVLDQVAPTRTYQQWRAETSEGAIIRSGFDIW